MSAAAASEACADLELTPNEVDAAWRVVVATGLRERPAGYQPLG